MDALKMKKGLKGIDLQIKQIQYKLFKNMDDGYRMSDENRSTLRALCVEKVYMDKTLSLLDCNVTDELIADLQEAMIYEVLEAFAQTRELTISKF